MKVDQIGNGGNVSYICSLPICEWITDSVSITKERCLSRAYSNAYYEKDAADSISFCSTV